MISMLKPLKRFFSSHSPIPPGLYHYQSPPEDPRNYRLHLRIESHGGGVLIINASTILHLNQTAAEYAYSLVKNMSPEETAERIAAKYYISTEQARQDYLDLIERIQLLISTPDLEPVSFLDMDRRRPFSGELTAPYHLDCALTYRLPIDQDPESAPIERVVRELSTSEWKRVLDIAWAAGIPHIIFTGGEPTLRDDLPELIAHAENNGQVCGLLTDGSRLADGQYLDQLLKAGLDHLLVTLHPADEQSWKAVGNAIVEDLALTVHVTLSDADDYQAEPILERLGTLGVQSISLSASDHSLSRQLQSMRDKAASAGFDLIWNVPVPYSTIHPVAFEAEDAEIEGAGKAWLYIEPDGDVRPAQGSPDVLGNMLTDPWEKLWKQSRL